MKIVSLRATILGFVFCCMTLSVYADSRLRIDTWYSGEVEGDIRFSKEGEVEIKLYALFEGETEQRIKSPYQVEYVNKVPFLRFGENFQDKWLFLHLKHFLFVCKTEKEELFPAFSEGGKRLAYITPLTSTATSYLVEGATKYVAENLKTFAPSRPWVEGVKGHGIGEKIILRSGRPLYEPGHGIGILVFSNGYVSYDKPYLYEKNARVKRLRVTNRLKDFDFEVDVEDTPNPQLIFLPVETMDIELEIIDVYPGTQWEDTCINFIWKVEELLSFLFKENQ